jgi:GT2 family glycosyltransferase
MVEISIIIATLIEDKEDIPAVRSLNAQDFEDYEVLIERGPTASSSRNAGIERAKADKLIFLDDDSVVKSGFLESVDKALDKHSAIRGKVIHPHNDVFYTISKPLYDLGDEEKSVDAFTGCNMAIRKDILEKTGGFDNELPYGHEETELAFRVKKYTDIFYVPNAEVEHCYADSYSEFFEKMYRHGYSAPIYWKKTEKPIKTRIESLIPYASSETIPATALYSLGSLIGTLGALRGYLSLLVQRGIRC